MDGIPAEDFGIRAIAGRPGPVGDDQGGARAGLALSYQDGRRLRARCPARAGAGGRALSTDAQRRWI